MLPEPAAAERETTAWVDTNTMLQVYSHGDLFDAHEAGAPLQRAQRLLELRGALWMTMALCQRLVRSESFHRECERNILRMAPPNTKRGVWTQIVLYLLGDCGVFDGWDPKAGDEGPLGLSNKQRDRYMIDQCRDRGLIMISRDKEARQIALSDGVHAVTPEEYGAEVLTLDQARAMFMERMRRAVAAYPGHYPPEERATRGSQAQVAFEVFEKIWR